MRLVVGAHLDDAALSAGSYLAETRDPVLTVFAGWPTGGVTDYDAAAGFRSSHDAMGARRAEDIEAMDCLGCESVHLPWLDHQYGGERPEPTHLAATFAKAAADVGAGGVVGPLGIQHPDHLLVAEALVELAETGVPVWMYEDLPYRVVWPELAAARLEAVRRVGWSTNPDFIGGGPTEAKAEAIASYRSQPVDAHCCLVPERFWRLAR